ncbi:MAG: M48 family peptidase [Alphaproteobacteria bacterium]|nr:MAG: M48 family peptidase [Alphaproteobacteria bacterium]
MDNGSERALREAALVPTGPEPVPVSAHPANDQPRGAYYAFGPVAAVIDAFNCLYPGKVVSIDFIPEKQCVGEDGIAAQAFALFPDEGGPPEIWVSDATPVLGLPDTIAHELAHIAAGAEADHGPEFDAAYEAIWQEMTRRLAPAQ